MKPSEEEWRPVVGWEGLYEVSSMGRVKQVGVPASIKKDTWGSRVPRIVGQSRRNGYLRVRLRDDFEGVSPESVHVLVCDAFSEGPRGEVVRHLDGSRDNNTRENLKWGTAKENSLDRKSHGREPNLNKTQCPQGHSYSDKNVYRSPGSGHRQCLVCMKLRSAKVAPVRNLIRSKGLPDESPRHGTEAGYKHNGCRCNKCRRAASEAYQRRKNENLD